MLIFTEKYSARLDYTLSFLFKELFDVTYYLTDDISLYANSKEEVKICYSQNNVGGIHITPDTLLFENDITPKTIENGKWDTIPTIFKNENLDVPFDIFAATFYLISRYEEYLPSEKDNHGRFQAKHSIAFKYKFLDEPIINVWAEKFNQLLNNKLTLKNQYKPIITFDIDLAYAYAGKSFFKTIAGLLRDALKLKFKLIYTRIRSVLNPKNDPANSFDYIFNTLKKWRKSSVIFFFLNGEKSQFDRNLPLSNSLQKNVVLNCKKHGEIGIHPSYESNNNFKAFNTELTELENVIESPIISSRQHFLKLNLPTTYRSLIKENILNDYTMGCADNLGFRASTCTPFYWFDLEKNSKSTLKVYPVGLMDGTLYTYLKLSPEKAIIEAKKHIDKFKEHQGTFVLLWHNTTFDESVDWKGWKIVYEEILSYCNAN